MQLTRQVKLGKLVKTSCSKNITVCFDHDFPPCNKKLQSSLEIFQTIRSARVSEPNALIFSRTDKQ